MTGRCHRCGKTWKNLFALPSGIFCLKCMFIVDKESAERVSSSTSEKQVRKSYR